MSLKVMLVDGQELVRDGLKVVLGAHDNMSVVGEAGDGCSAVSEATRLKPDVVVMDISLPELSGTEATKQIKAQEPGCKVLAYSAHEARSDISTFLGAGASGYLLKRSALSELPRAVRTIAAGGTYIDPAAAGNIWVATSRKRRGQPFMLGLELSERETEVLRLIARGYAWKQIGVELCLSARTVETYKLRAMSKLQLKTRADVVRHAAHQGWLDRV